MNIVYIHSAYTPNDLIGNWFSVTRKWAKSEGGNAFFVIKFTRRNTQKDDLQVGNSLSCWLHSYMFNKFGLQDCFSYFATRKLLKRLDLIKPHVIHLHVINDCFLHLGLLCKYVNKHNIKVVWTFHDARVLTGMCPCPNYCECDKWKTVCRDCNPIYKFVYPSKPVINLVRFVHNYRKHNISKIKKLMIVTPSKWMASMVSQSYLKDKKCIVINNGINITEFHPTENNIREKYNISPNIKILLSIGNPISILKGREYLYKLAKELPQGFVLIMVGCVQDDIIKFEGNKHVFALPRIDRDELLKFYSAADLFINPTLADNFPTVNLEAQACGCPVVAFDSDGTPETVDPQRGKIVPRNNYEALKEAIFNFKYDGASESAISFASQFDQKKCINEYIRLYKEL
ncbi:MAG: glycosyltransferase [Phocaeicola sp.]|nr:glycosyltransferase [Phocaeicola sp.]